MPISSLNTAFIQPTKPKTVSYTNTTAAVNTYYTVLSTTGRGLLSRITLTNAPAVENQYLNIRITIDGVQNTITGSNVNTARAFVHMDSNSTTNGYAKNSIDYFCNCYYKSSMTIEVMQSTYGTTFNLFCAVDYATE